MGKKSRKPKNNKTKKGEAVRLASASAPGKQPPAGASCWICLDSDPDDGGKPIVRDCSCRGDGAGYAHLSCLAHYAESKTKEELKKGAAADLLDSMKPWEYCPHCCQRYQRQVAMDMANSFLATPMAGSQIPKMCGLNLLLNSIHEMDYHNSQTLRETGKRAATQLISVILLCNDSFANFHYMMAYLSLAKFSEAEHTNEGYETALLNYKKLRDWHKARGDARKVREVNEMIDTVKARRDGEMKNLLINLWGSGFHGLENERLADKLLVISRRVHGPEHPTTKEFQDILERCKRREVGIISAGGIRGWRVLRFNEDDGKYVLKGPILHGLKNAAHLNGKVGDIKSKDDKSGRYAVRFEDKSLKSALVKPENIRIILDLSAENVSWD